MEKKKNMTNIPTPDTESRSYQKVKAGMQGSERAEGQKVSLEEPRPSIMFFVTSGLQTD